jgi:predicted nucleotidyltransferase
MNIFEEDIDWSASCFENKEIDASVNKAVSHNLRILSQEIVRRLPDVLSIYLTGSYAASEGTVVIEDNDIKLLSDYDLVIITKEKASTANLCKKSFPNLKNIYEMPGHPMFEVFIWRRSELSKLSPTKFLYDFKSAKCIYGTEISASLPRFSASKIPISEGIRLVFNRAFGALVPFSPSMLNENPSVRKRRHLTFESVKLILGLCDALLITQGTYFTAPKKDTKKFLEELYSRFPQSTAGDPEIDDLIELALEYRIRPSVDIEQKALDLWFGSQSFLLMVLGVFFERLYRIKQSSLEEAIGRFVELNPQSFFLNGILSFNILKKHKRLYPQTLYRKPTNALLALDLLLLFSIDRKGKFDMNLLELARDLLAKHIGIRVDDKNPSRLWHVLKQYAVENYFDAFSPVAFPFSRKLTH